ncbi:ISL3 family transposase [Lentilactobacillus sp. Marseille-Q4993]|uniref:ISL3 family transposase n=1 Tax=Lentilactobacillus sp. Marseille-Q4993 TaxID=3039492 RepID=UPI0024BC019E|nr:ISL3 family transposase [Lentilactobacillus sp. Marseille-Q4993]
MSQDNSILDLLDIKDKNIQITKVKEENRYSGPQRVKFMTVYGRLTYGLTRCPLCGFPTIVKNGTRLTKLRIASLTGKELRLYLSKQRYLCQNCGHTCGAHTPIVKVNHSITNQVNQRINELDRNTLTVKMMAKLVGVSPSSVQRIMYSGRKAFLEHRELPKYLCFDEFRSVHSMFSFICIDAQTHNLVALLPNRLTKTIVDYFLNQYSLKERRKVKAVSMDLNAQYQHFIKRIFPNAEIVIDRFHIVQLAGRALDCSRTRILKGIEDHHSRLYKMLKSHWRLFHKNENEIDAVNVKYKFGINEKITEQAIIDTVIQAFPDFKIIYEEYQAILHAIHDGDVGTLQELINGSKPIKNEMTVVFTTFKKNWRGIVNACCSKLSNGPLEGVIRKVKELKRGCYGFKNMAHLFIRIRLIHD